MIPTTTERTGVVTTGLEASTVLLAGPAAATEAEVAGLLLVAAPVLMLTDTAIDVLAVLGVFLWVVALLVLVSVDASRAAHRRHTHQHDGTRQRRDTHHRSWVRR